MKKKRFKAQPRRTEYTAPPTKTDTVSAIAPSKWPNKGSRPVASSCQIEPVTNPQFKYLWHLFAWHLTKKSSEHTGHVWDVTYILWRKFNWLSHGGVDTKYPTSWASLLSSRKQRVGTRYLTLKTHTHWIKSWSSFCPKKIHPLIVVCRLPGSNVPTILMASIMGCNLV